MFSWYGRDQNSCMRARGLKAAVNPSELVLLKCVSRGSVPPDSTFMLTQEGFQTDQNINVRRNTMS